MICKWILVVLIKLSRMLNSSQSKKIFNKYKKMTNIMRIKYVITNNRIIKKLKSKKKNNQFHRLKMKYITVKKLNNSLLKFTNNNQFYKNSQNKTWKLQIIKIWWADSIDFQINIRSLIISKKLKSIKIWKTNCHKKVLISRQANKRLMQEKKIVKKRIK